MAADWREVTVGEIAAPVRNALVGGPFGSNLVSRDYVPSGVPVIRGQNMGGRWVTGEFAFVTHAKAKSLDSNIARPGDIIFTQRGTLGQVSLVPEGAYERYLVSQSQMKLTVNRRLADPVFFYYAFSTGEQRDYIRQNAIQTGVPHTNLGTLRKTPVPLPPLPEQRAIAHFLGTLDDKIELNRRMNETLEAVARALFKSWFVDFDPVRAKAEGCDPGLPKHVADLFSDRLVDSELGEIPEGWGVSSLGEQFEASKGVSYKGRGLSHGGTPLHNLNSIYEGGGYKYEGIKYYTEEFKTKHVVWAGDLIVANTEQGHDRLLIGYAAIVPAVFGEAGIASHHLCRVRPKMSSHLSTHFGLYLLNSGKMHGVISRYANGTTVNMLPLDGLRLPLIAVPPSQSVNIFTTFASRCGQRREELFLEAITLGALRDALLPKLVSGELCIKDADRFLERASA